MEGCWHGEARSRTSGTVSVTSLVDAKLKVGEVVGNGDLTIPEVLG